MSGKKLKEKREELGYSQSELAKISGVNFRTLQDYEQGRKPMVSVKGDVLLRLSTTLGCSIEDLLIETTSKDNDIYNFDNRILKYYEFFNNMLDKKNGKQIHTPFDDVFRTLSVDCPDLLIPIINQIFNENYKTSDMVGNRQNEHLVPSENDIKKTISDSNIIVVEKSGNKNTYQIECQSRSDSSILIRLFEYSQSIAIEDAVIEGNKISFSFPKSALIYLRHTANTPSKMEYELITPGGNISWDVPILKSQVFSINDIFQKQLYMLIPYYLLKYENTLKAINNDNDRVNNLTAEINSILSKLEQAVNDGYINSYQHATLVNMSKLIYEYLTNNYKNIYKEIKKTMGGQVLEYEAKTILRNGIAQGISQGIAQGSLEKSETVFLNMIKKGYDFDEAVAISEIPLERATELIK